MKQRRTKRKGEHNKRMKENMKEARRINNEDRG